MTAEGAPTLFRSLAGEPNTFRAYPMGTGIPASRRLALTEFSDEAELIREVLTRLAPSFHVDREVWDTHCGGKRLRIDAILRPRDTEGWKDADVRQHRRPTRNLRSTQARRPHPPGLER